MLTRFEGKMLRPRSDSLNRAMLITNEGPNAVKEAIEYLKFKAPRNAKPLVWSEDMRSSCRDHVNDLGPKGITGHTGSDGSSPNKRILRYLKDPTMTGENLAFGTEEALQVLIDLIVDDGVPDRGHRTNIFLKEWEMHGTFTGKHTYYDVMMCQNFAAGSAKIKTSSVKAPRLVSQDPAPNAPAFIPPPKTSTTG